MLDQRQRRRANDTAPVPEQPAALRKRNPLVGCAALSISNRIAAYGQWRHTVVASPPGLTALPVTDRISWG